MLCISDELFFLLPVIVYTIFYILSFFKKSPQTIKFIRIIKYDRKFIRRVYYLFNLAWFITFSIRYYNDIKDMAFVFHDSNFGGIINIVLLLTIFFLFSLFWDMLFISCRSISSLTFKGVTITTDDIEKIKSSAIITKEIIESLYNVLKTQDYLVMHLEDFLSAINNLNLDDFFNIYEKLINQYARKRKNIKFNCFEYNDNGIEKFKEKYKLSESSASSILYSLKTCGVCIPQDTDLDYDIIYAVLETMHYKDNIIVVLESENLIIDEHLIIQHLIILFDYQIIVHNLINAYIDENEISISSEGSDSN